ncbi:MAG: Methyltransferase type 11 [Alphaproteobacteria bacterium]|nr:Methyltransferase type 11 [Alphaproteobacteria bacterium]
MKLESLIASQAGLGKAEGTDPEGGVRPLLALLQACQGPIRPGAAILDFGCGVGHGVSALLGLGYDAQGTDIYEYWGRDAPLYWENSSPPPEVAGRLSVSTLKPYRLPYPDATFDHVLSVEVLEHVDDRQAVFAEIRRVLKPGGTSAHIYPGRWVPLMEGHINVPFPVLCRYPAWLKAMAFLGFRGDRQRGMDRRSVLAANREQMQITSYPTRRQMLRWAREEGLEARFAEADYVARGGTGWARLYGILSPLGWAATIAARLVLENMLVLRRVDHGALP